LKRSLLLAVMLIGLVASRPADAGDDAATDLLREGLKLRREHRNEEAIDAFTRAYALAPSPIALAQIALAEQAAGRWLDAERDLAAATHDPTDPWVARHKGALDDAAQTIAQHLAWLTVRSPTTAASATLDGKAIAMGVEIRVLAGAAELVVSADGYASATRTWTIEPASRHTIDIALAPATDRPSPEADPPATRRESDAPRSPRALFAPSAGSTRPPIATWTLLGAGAVGIGLSAYFGIRVLHDKSGIDDACVGRPRCDPAATGLYSDAQTSATLSTIAGGVGLAAVTSAVVFWAVDRGRSRGATRGLRVAPSVGSHHQGVVLRGDL